MRKFAALLPALMLLSCTALQIPETSGESLYCIVASTEESPRTVLEKDGDSYSVLWSEGDSLLVTSWSKVSEPDAECQYWYWFHIEEGAGTQRAVFSSTLGTRFNITAFYPGNIGVKNPTNRALKSAPCWPSSFSITESDTAENSPISGVPMVGCGTSAGSTGVQESTKGLDNVHFYNMGGILRLAVTADKSCSVSRVELSADEPMSGHFMMNLESEVNPYRMIGSDPVPKFVSSGPAPVSLVTDGSVEIGPQTRFFNIPVPARADDAAYNNVRVRICIAGADTLTFKSPSLQIKRSCISRVSLSVTVPPSDPEECVREDIIPDFSGCGYHYGDDPLPSAAPTTVLSAPEGDATSLIQEAVAAGGVVLLKDGTYNISSTISLGSGTVLRGESEQNTVIFDTRTGGSEDNPLNSIVIGAVDYTMKTSGTTASIIGSYGCGTKALRVNTVSGFSVGDEVRVQIVQNDAWLSALHMDNIEGSGVSWGNLSLNVARKILRIEDDFLILDAPITTSINPAYNISATVRKYSSNARVSESGVENLTLQSVCAGSTDEAHAWVAVQVCCAQHCWVRNVTSKYYAGSCVEISGNTRNITVDGCSSLEPRSRIEGSRRYAFNLTGASHTSAKSGSPTLCLIKNCMARKDRHQFATTGRIMGPNVFLDCSSSDSYAVAGPHMKWATGTLYDCLTIGGSKNGTTGTSDISVLQVTDTGAEGSSGHGWNGANNVFWNCTAAYIVCESPWMAEDGYSFAKNYCIGCTGTKKRGNQIIHIYGASDTLGTRPDGVWESNGVPVTAFSGYGVNISGSDRSLYRSQRAAK